MTTHGPQPGLGFFGAGTTSGGSSQDISALQAQVSSLLAKVDGAIDKIEVAGNDITFTSVDGQKHVEALPGGVQPFTLTADKITRALSQGEAPNTGTLSGLASGWWYIPSSVVAPSLKGRPPGMTGSGILFKTLTADKLGGNKGVMMVYGQNAKLDDTMWVRFKTDGTTWGSWIEYPNATAMLSDLDTAIKAVQSQQATDKATLDHLNQVVTGLISDVAQEKQDIAALQKVSIPSLADIQKHLTDQGWGPLTAHLTEAEVEKALVAKGWGPLPAQLTVDDVKKALEAAGWGPQTKPSPHSGGGDHPVVQLPKVWIMFDASVPTDLTSATTTTTGEATVRKVGSGNERLWVIVEKDVSAKVEKIQVGSSLAAVWDSRDFSIGGQQYTGFYSAGGFTVFNKKVTIEFGG